jgi:hypothetical protein
LISRKIKLSTGIYSRLTMKLFFERSLGYYITQIYIPSTLLVVLSWVSFWLDRTAAPARVSLGITTVLTMVTFIWSTNASLPKISYVKSIDVYLVFCFFMTFGSVIEFGIVSFINLSFIRKQRKAAQLEQQQKQRVQLQAQIERENSSGLPFVGNNNDLRNNSIHSSHNPNNEFHFNFNNNNIPPELQANYSRSNLQRHSTHFQNLISPQMSQIYQNSNPNVVVQNQFKNENEPMTSQINNSLPRNMPIFIEKEQQQVCSCNCNNNPNNNSNYLTQQQYATIRKYANDQSGICGGGGSQNIDKRKQKLLKRSMNNENYQQQQQQQLYSTISQNQQKYSLSSQQNHNQQQAKLIRNHRGRLISTTPNMPLSFNDSIAYYDNREPVMNYY